jgi:hypothetical protein
VVQGTGQSLVVIRPNQLSALFSVNGAIYKKSGGRLEKLEVSGNGSHIDDLIKAIRDTGSEIL